MTDHHGEIGIHFKCLRGANSHFALTEPNSFALQDSAGRDWVCYPVSSHVVRQLDMLADFAEIDHADEKACEETDYRLVFCRSVNELPERLAEEKG
jgi:hypothetical protein